MNGATKYGTLVAALVAIVLSWVDPSGDLSASGQAAVSAGSLVVIGIIHALASYEKVKGNSSASGQVGSIPVENVTTGNSEK